MFASAHGRRLAKLLAVLLGVLLWVPGTQALGAKIAPPSESTVSRAEADDSPVGELEANEAPSAAREAEDGEDSESSFVGPQLYAPRLRLTAAGSTRLAAPEYERERLSAAHNVLARERGPPMI
ncbi:hypothetical protein [Enhygromyxa salina]|uniref:Uncharacterized protein n=1 Tax=Enhygromyxa salina TaxID=215803 RepID=A0A2S9YYJ6_9BACT|nr:hypothetical protein [Enhygromyxa salina]PRQ10142.1 hypothetical protein ENSA7_00910 [Enhygromyxa salina]